MSINTLGFNLSIALGALIGGVLRTATGAGHSGQLAAPRI